MQFCYKIFNILHNLNEIWQVTNAEWDIWDVNEIVTLFFGQIKAQLYFNKISY